MSKYNAQLAAENGEHTFEQAATAVQTALWDLQGRTYSHWPWRPKLLARTDSGKHYRLSRQLADYLDIEIVDLPGTHVTEPPTVLATVSATIAGVEAYLEHEPVVEVVASLKRALAARLPLQ